MQEALYPVPQGGGQPTPPSRLLVGKTDPAPINRVLPLGLQGIPRDPLTVRQPLLFQPPLPAGTALTSNIIVRGRSQETLAALDTLGVRRPLLSQPPLPGGFFNTKLLLAGYVSPDLLPGALTVRQPLIYQPPLPGGFFNTKLVLSGRIPADLQSSQPNVSRLGIVTTVTPTSSGYDFWHYYSP